MVKSAGKTTRAPRAKSAATKPKPSGGNPRAKPGNNSSNLNPDEVRALFLSNRTEFVAALAKQKAAKKLVDDVVTQAKADGFTKKELELSVQLADLKGERKVEADVATTLRVARWIGHKMGAQADLFEQPDRTPSVDRAFDAGKQASMEGAARKPPHSPETPQYASWMAGFDEDQGRLQSQVGRGPVKDQPAPTSGLRMSRADYAEQQRLAAEKAPGDEDTDLSVH